MHNLKLSRGASVSRGAVVKKSSSVLRNGVSGLSLNATMALVVVAGAGAFAPDAAFAQSCVGFAYSLEYPCGSPTIDTEYSNSNDDPVLNGRLFQAGDDADFDLVNSADSDVTGFGLAIVNDGEGRVSMANDGSITVDAGNAPSAGGTAALSLESNGGEIRYTGEGSIANLGSGAGLGVVATGGSIVDLTIGGNVSSVGAAAVDVLHDGSGAISIDARGDLSGASGLRVASTGSSLINVTSQGDVTATGGLGVYISSSENGDDITLAVGNVTVVGDEDDGDGQWHGVYVKSRAIAANIDLKVDGDVQGANGGIVVDLSDADAEGNISVRFLGAEASDPDSTDITPRMVSGQAGLAVRQAGIGAVSITGDANFDGSALGLLLLQENVNSTSEVTVDLIGNISGNGEGIGTGATVVANTAGEVSFLLDGSILASEMGLGVANSGSGNIRIDVSGAISAKNAVIVRASDIDSGAITAGFGGAVTGLGGIGADVTLGGGDNELTFEGDVSGHSGEAGIRDADGIRVDGSGNLRLEAKGAVSALDGDIAGGATAISVGLSEGDARLFLSGAISSASGTAISVVTGEGEIEFESDGDIVAYEDGIELSTDLGDIIFTNRGNITVGDEAIDLFTLNGSITLTNYGDITADGDGIELTAIDGDVTATNHGAITSGDLGVDIYSDMGNIVFETTGDIVAEGSAIFLRAEIGSVHATLSGRISGQDDAVNAYGITGTRVDVMDTAVLTGDVNLYSTSDIVFSNAGLINIDADGAVHDSIININADSTPSLDVDGDPTHINIAITNSGSIGSLIHSSQQGGTFTLTNTGLIDGAFYIYGADSGQIDNQGDMRIRNESVVETDFNNSGVLTFIEADPRQDDLPMEPTSLTVKNFTNSGVIAMANGAVGERLVVDGDFAGGGSISLDYNADGSSNDELHVNGDVTGSTTVTFERFGTLQLLDGNFQTLVSVDGDVSEDSFVSTNSFPTMGLIQERFGQNPADGQSFGVIQTLNAASRGLAHVVQIAETASAALDESISPYVTQKKADGPAVQLGSWGRMGTGTANQELGATVSGRGLTTGGADKARTKTKSLQLGMDLGATAIGGGNWNVHAGVTGGWYEAEGVIRDLGQVEIEADFLGGYALVGNGKFQLEGQVRREWRDLTVRVGDLTSSVLTSESKAWAGHARASYRLGGEAGFSATPFAEYAFGTSKFDSVQIDSLARFEQADHKRERGEAGLEIGYRQPSTTGFSFEPFVSAAWLKNWSNDASGRYLFGAEEASFAVASESWDEAVRLSWGIKAHSASGRYGLFLNGTTVQASDVKSVAVHVGGRINF